MRDITVDLTQRYLLLVTRFSLEVMQKRKKHTKCWKKVSHRPEFCRSGTFNINRNEVETVEYFVKTKIVFATMCAHDLRSWPYGKTIWSYFRLKF